MCVWGVRSQYSSFLLMWRIHSGLDFVPTLLGPPQALSLRGRLQTPARSAVFKSSLKWKLTNVNRCAADHTETLNGERIERTSRAFGHFEDSYISNVI